MMEPATPKPLSEPDPLTGTQLGGFVKGDLIGAGAMERVCRGKQLSLEREIAIKVLPPEFAKDETNVEPFRREPQPAAAVQNAHIVQIIDYGEQDRVFSYVMELKQEHSKRKLMGIRTAFARSRPIKTATHSFNVLKATHTARIAHRHVKPKSLIFYKNSRIKMAYLVPLPTYNGDGDATLPTKATMPGMPPYVRANQMPKNECLAYPPNIFPFGQSSLIRQPSGRVF